MAFAAYCPRSRLRLMTVTRAASCLRSKINIIHFCSFISIAASGHGQLVRSSLVTWHFGAQCGWFYANLAPQQKTSLQKTTQKCMIKNVFVHLRTHCRHEDNQPATYFLSLTMFLCVSLCNVIWILRCSSCIWTIFFIIFLFFFFCACHRVLALILKLSSLFFIFSPPPPPPPPAPPLIVIFIITPVVSVVTIVLCVAYWHVD